MIKRQGTNRRKKKASRKPKKGRKSGYAAACCATALAVMTAEPDLAKLALKLRVSLATIYNWMAAHPKFAEAIEQGKGRFADKVETGFLALAVAHDEVVETVGEEMETKTKKDCINVRAAERVLKAYKPDKYGDKLDVKGDINVSLVGFADVKRADSGS
jgi:hypothetical protein